jgi:hypothetical protein
LTNHVALLAAAVMSSQGVVSGYSVPIAAIVKTSITLGEIIMFKECKKPEIIRISLIHYL